MWAHFVLTACALGIHSCTCTCACTCILDNADILEICFIFCVSVLVANQQTIVELISFAQRAFPRELMFDQRREDQDDAARARSSVEESSLQVPVHVCVKCTCRYIHVWANTL